MKVSGIALLTFVIMGILIPLPDPLFNVPYSTTLRGSDGSLLSAEIASDEQWRFPQSDSVPEKLKTALLLFEDEYYNFHLGLNPVSLIRATKQNLEAGKVVSGGSTLTMQTVRMAYGNKQRTYSQKLLEIAAALKLEVLYSKSSILKLYVDHAPFGGNIVGVSAASYRYFGRPPNQLSWAEAATLAILPNDPSSIFPGRNQEEFLSKRNRLLNKIRSREIMDDDELFLAKEEPLPQSIKPIPNYAYHLLHRFGKEGKKGKDVLTTLNPKLQVKATQLVNEHSRTLSYSQIHNAAAVIIEVKSGNTLAYVGNSNAKGEHGQHVDIITSRRSPGSLLKPFLYAAAMDESLITPYTLLPDIPVFYKGFAPKNFDKEYRGAVPADDALISSLNVPFVHLLIEYGYEKFHQKLVQMGFQSFDKPAGHYGLSMILGGAESTLWELTSVYASTVRAHQNYMDRPYNSGYSKSDYYLNKYIQEERIDTSSNESDGYLRVPSIRFTIEAMRKLNRPEAEAGWKQFESSKNIAWKTGTSYGFRDGWAIGFNNDYLIGVWVGNADGEGRSGLTGVSTAAPLLFSLFDLVDGNSELEEPHGIEYSICKHSGMLAGKECPENFTRKLPQYVLSTEKCSYHKRIHLDKRKKNRVNSSCYDVSEIENESWFVLPPVQAWYYKKFHPNYRKLPPYLDGCMQADNSIQFGLIYPHQFTKVKIPLEQNGERGYTIFEAAHQNKDALVYWHIDDEYLGYTKGMHQKGIQTSNGSHLLTLVDQFGNELVQRFEVID